MRILVINEGDSPNIGDQAINIAVKEALNKKFERGLLVENLSLQKGKLLSATEADENKKLSDSEIPSFSYIYHFLWICRYLFRALKNINIYRKSDLAIIGGGGIVMDNRLQFPTAIYINSLILKFFNIPFHVMGVSVSDTMSPTAYQLIKKSFLMARSIALRDDISNAALVNRGIRGGNVIGDFAVCLFNGYGSNVTKDYYLAINVSTSVEDNIKYLKCIKETIRTNNDKRVCLLTTGDIGDEQLADKIKEEMGSYNIDVVKAKSPDEYTEVCGKSEFVIATRLHGGILSLLVNHKTVIVNVGKKQSGFFNSLGISNHIFNLESEDMNVCSIFEHLEVENTVSERLNEMCLKISRELCFH